MLSIGRLSRFSLRAAGLGLVLLLFAGCPESQAPPQPTGETIYSEDEIRRFFPLEVGNFWTYTVSNGAQITYEILSIQEKSGGPAATMEVISEGTPSTEYIRWSGVNLLSSRNEEFTDEHKELDGPLHEGARWRKVNDSGGESVFYIDCEILALHHPISVPAGSYEAMAVQEITHREFPPAPPSIDTTYVYYVQDVGIVRWDVSGLIYNLVQYEPGEGEIAVVGE